MENHEASATQEPQGSRTALTVPTENPNWSRDLIKEIAMDIGKDVVAYIEVQYPKAIEATSSTFKLSVRNCIYNQIMAAIEVTDEGEVRARLKDRKIWRRQWTAAWRKIRGAVKEERDPSTNEGQVLPGSPITKATEPK